MTTIAHYVISDVHGEGDRYFAMKEAICFSPDDMLFILGDIIDGGPDGLTILRDVMDTPNIIALRGNHEQACLDTLYYKTNPRSQWSQRKGKLTCYQLLHQTSPAERNRLLRFMAYMHTSRNITVDGKPFHLVHAWPSPSPMRRLWMRAKPDFQNPFWDQRTVIIGHTTVCSLREPDDKAVDQYLAEMVLRGEKMTIAHCPGFIAIDCGCGRTTAARQLACLRLEDMAEFYT